MAYKIAKIQGRWRKYKKRYEITKGRSFLGLHLWKWSIYFPIGDTFGKSFTYNTLFDRTKKGV